MTPLEFAVLFFSRYIIYISFLILFGHILSLVSRRLLYRKIVESMRAGDLRKNIFLKTLTSSFINKLFSVIFGMFLLPFMKISYDLQKDIFNFFFKGSPFAEKLQIVFGPLQYLPMVRIMRHFLVQDGGFLVLLALSVYFVLNSFFYANRKIRLLRNIIKTDLRYVQYFPDKKGFRRINTYLNKSEYRDINVLSLIAEEKYLKKYNTLRLNEAELRWSVFFSSLFDMKKNRTLNTINVVEEISFLYLERKPWKRYRFSKLVRIVESITEKEGWEIIPDKDFLSLVSLANDKEAAEMGTRASIKGVLLIVSGGTSSKDIEVFLDRLATSCSSIGAVLVEDERAFERFQIEFSVLAQIHKSTVKSKPRKKDLIKLVNFIKGKLAFQKNVTAMEILCKADRGITRMEQLSTAGESEKALKELSEIFTDIVNKSPLSDCRVDSINTMVYLYASNFKPVQRMLKNLAEEESLSAKIYIIFNIFEIIVKSLAAIVYIKRGMCEGPRAIPQSNACLDYATANSLLRDIDKEVDSIEIAAIREYLITPIGKRAQESIQNLHFSVPYFNDCEPRTIGEVFELVGFLRNQTRGHGIVTNIIATSIYPILGALLNDALSHIDFGSIRIEKLENDAVAFINEKRIELHPFILFDKSNYDFLFFEEATKQELTYISYASGSRYRPTIQKFANDLEKIS